MIKGTNGGLIGARPPAAKSKLVDAHRRTPLNTGQMLTDSLTWRELKLVHNLPLATGESAGQLADAHEGP
jgi:hypothetical protein